MLSQLLIADGRIQICTTHSALLPALANAQLPASRPFLDSFFLLLPPAPAPQTPLPFPLYPIPLFSRVHFLVRITFNGFTSPQLRSVPCSSSAFNSAAVCNCRFSSATVSGAGASAIARLTASTPCLNKS